MTSTELLEFLQEFHRNTLDLFLARQANARAVSAYDANNAYQQILGRQDVHVRWLADAVAELGGSAPDPQDAPERATPAGADGNAIIEADVRGQQAFIDRWTPRVAAVTNARHRKMLRLILGEMAEHLRMLQLAREGRSDLLGRHADGKVLRGVVMAVRPRN